MEKSQHTDFNKDKTNESASVACSHVYGCESWTLRKNEDTRLEAYERTEKDSACFVDSKKQMSGFSTKLE